MDRRRRRRRRDLGQYRKALAPVWVFACQALAQGGSWRAAGYSALTSIGVYFSPNDSSLTPSNTPATARNTSPAPITLPGRVSEPKEENHDQ